MAQTNAAKQRAYRQRKARKKRNAQALLNPRKSINVQRPALRYFGGKWRLANWIIDKFPAHVSYVEPFMGAASVFLQKTPSEIECLNDLDGDVVNFFDVLRSQTDELVQAIQLTPYARDEYMRAFQLPADAPPVERARALYVRAWQGFDPSDAVSGMSPSWRRQTSDSRGKSVTSDWSSIEHLYAVAARFRQAQIENRPAVQVIQEFDSPGTLFYVDPPYLPETRNAHDSQYAHEMTPDQHSELLGLLNSLQGMVVLSGYPSPLYDAALEQWERMTRNARTNNQSTATEVIWLNPAAAEKRLPMLALLDAVG